MYFMKDEKKKKSKDTHLLGSYKNLIKELGE